MLDERDCQVIGKGVLRRSMPNGPVALLASILLGVSPSALSDAPTKTPNCEADAMIVFDASGSMAGMGFGETTVTRIEQVRRALAQVLPSVAPVRHLGLITFGPGSRKECENIDLKLPPGPNSAERIMAEINKIQPYGQTPIGNAVSAAAEALNFRKRPAVIVLLTDGEETCGGNLCALGRRLKTEGAAVTVHVIGFMLSLANAPTSGQFVSCLSENTDGLFLSTESIEELVDALRQTLECPVISSLAPIRR
jgi:Ca-activated chloride channel family protein